MSEFTESKGFHISLSTVVALCAVSAYAWGVIKPALLASISTAYAGELDAIKTEQADVKVALTELTKTVNKLGKQFECKQVADSIVELEDEIEALEEADSEAIKDLTSHKRNQLAIYLQAHLKCIN